MTTPRHRHPIITNPGYPNTTETQENDLKFDPIMVPEVVDRVAVSAVPASAAAVQAAVEVVEVAMAAAEDLVEVATEAFTTVMDMEGIITPRGLTGGVTEPAL